MKQRGFSLVEVIIAIAVVSTAVLIALSLLPILTRQTRESTDLQTVQRLTDLITLEMRRRSTGAGFDAFAAAIPVMAAPLMNGHAFVVSSDGGKIASESESEIANDDQRFLVEMWRFAEPPLRFDPNASVLAAYVRVSWPYRIPGSETPTAAKNRSTFAFTIAINR